MKFQGTRVACALLLLGMAGPVGCGDSQKTVDGAVDVYVLAPETDSLSSGGALFAARYSRQLPVENPNVAAGTRHGDDLQTRSRIEAFTETVDGATHLLILPAEDPTPEGSDVRMRLAGCRPNVDLLAEVAKAGETPCTGSDLGRRLRFANVQFARIAPAGPFHIYRDYATQAIPVLYGAGGCLAGAWRCDPERTGFDGVLIATYPSVAEILQVAQTTSMQGPGGDYGDASYEELRLGGAEFLVRNFVDVDPTTPNDGLETDEAP